MYEINSKIFFLAGIFFFWGEGVILDMFFLGRGRRVLSGVGGHLRVIFIWVNMVLMIER